MSIANGSSTGGWQEDSQRQFDLDLSTDFKAPTMAEWRQVATAELKGADFDKKLLWQTPEGITIQPIYTRGDKRRSASDWIMQPDRGSTATRRRRRSWRDAADAR